MPELAEVEAYRRLAERAVGRRVAQVVAPDAWYLKGGLTAADAAAALEGRRLTAVRRIGKLLLIETGGPERPAGAGGAGPERPTGAGGAGPELPAGAGGGGPAIGLRFGMSGRLLVDGAPGVERLLYTSDQDLARWDRFVLRFRGGGDLRVRDARRLGGVELDPDEARMGPDALELTPSGLARVLGDSRAPLKARLMDQARLAGVGNLAADELLWRASLDPARAAGSLTPTELRRLYRHLRATFADLLQRGGSHTGELVAERRPGGVCPRDGTALVRRTIGGRTTWSCQLHQQ